jgi:hypothetical protein
MTAVRRETESSTWKMAKICDVSAVRETSP